MKLPFKGVGLFKRSNDICCISIPKITKNYGSSLGMLFGVALIVIAESSSEKYYCKQTTEAQSEDTKNTNNQNPSSKTP